MSELALTIPGPPRTKKNHGRIIRVAGRPKMIPSKAWQDWRDIALPVLARTAWHPINWPVNCRALFYRYAACGDAVGYYQGLADLLEAAGIVENDKWIVSWDFSRLLSDRANPRVDVVLSW